MTQAETLAKAREISRGTTCFLVPVRGAFKVCRRVAGRVITLASQALIADALDKAEAFLVGFEDDPDQVAVPVALATIRAALNAIRGGDAQ